MVMVILFICVLLSFIIVITVFFSNTKIVRLDNDVKLTDDVQILFPKDKENRDYEE